MCGWSPLDLISFNHVETTPMLCYHPRKRSLSLQPQQLYPGPALGFRSRRGLAAEELLHTSQTTHAQFTLRPFHVQESPIVSLRISVNPYLLPVLRLFVFFFCRRCGVTASRNTESSKSSEISGPELAQTQVIFFTLLYLK